MESPFRFYLIMGPQMQVISFDKAQDECNACCCTPVSGAPGNSVLMLLDFSEWGVPIGGHGLRDTLIKIKLLSPRPNASDYPVATPVEISGSVNTQSAGTLAATGGATPYTFELDDFDGPQHGNLVVQANGAYTYDPAEDFIGYDSAYFKVTDASGRVGVGFIGIKVSGEEPLPSIPAPAKVQVISGSVKQNRDFTVSLGLQIGPDAVPGEIYRVEIKQLALGCDGVQYSTNECLDLKIGKC